MKQLSLIVSIVALVVAGIALYIQLSNKKTPSPVVSSAGKGSNNSVQGSDFRIAYFEMDSIENNYQYVKDSYAQVKSKEESINNELGSIERSYQKKIAEWQQRGAQMSQSESEQVQREYAQMQQNYQSRKMKLEQELNDLRNKKLRDIQLKIENPENWILQRKVTYADIIETPDDPAKAELRIFYFWKDGDARPKPVNNLARLSKGKMIGVSFNKDKTWVGGSLCYFEQ